MTEQQIEAAARLLCEKRGIDPDERRGAYGFHKVKNPMPNWTFLADEIRASYEVLTSIATVMDMEGK